MMMLCCYLRFTTARFSSETLRSEGVLRLRKILREHHDFGSKDGALQLF
jgi:hypothetical protein